MIIDCHGHYTTAPDLHTAFRDAQLAHAKNTELPAANRPDISDDQIRESIELNQLKLQRDRGSDLTIFSPRASTMGHHEGTEAVSQEWTIACNDLVKRVVDLYPENFIGVCQLPQSPGVPIANSIAELERCVTELGFVGCNLNPDPSGGHWRSPIGDFRLVVLGIAVMAFFVVVVNRLFWQPLYWYAERKYRLTS